MTLIEYIEMTSDPEKKKFLREQWEGATSTGVIECCCGIKRHLTMAYRCLYCGLWFCFTCSETHFGQTVHEWTVQKRVEKRKELETSMAQKRKEMEDSILQDGAPKCRCGKPCVYYGRVGGYSKHCAECNAAKALQSKLSRARIKAAKENTL